MNQILDQSDLTERAARLVEAARKAGADSADAVCIRGISLSVDVRLGKVEETQRAEGDSFTLRAFVGRRSASVSANILTDPAELAERAVAMARVAPENPHAGLADPALLARSLADCDLLDPSVATAAELTEAAREAEDAARAIAGVTNSGGASASWGLGGLVLATSTGFAGAYLGSRSSLSVSAIAGEGTGMERDYDSESKAWRADLPPPASIGRKAGERAVRRLNPRQMPTGRATIVYDPRVSVTLVGHLSSAINGAAIARKTSFLRDKLGTRLFPESIEIDDDPTRLRAPASRPFDGEGLAPAPMKVIEGGVLKTWFLDSASARELGLVSNARAMRGGGDPSPGSTNLTLRPGKQTPEELIAAVGNGIYVNELIGHGVNGLTGDYSRGAAGFAIRDGKLAEAVSEITIAGNLLDMFQHLEPASDLTFRFALNAPTVAIEGMTVAGR